MNFEEFREQLDNAISKIETFELLEYQYSPYSFGSGLIAYKIKGRNIKFSYDGRDKNLEVNVSKNRQKYFSCEWEKKYYCNDMLDCLSLLKTIISF